MEHRPSIPRSRDPRRERPAVAVLIPRAATTSPAMAVLVPRAVATSPAVAVLVPRAAAINPAMAALVPRAVATNPAMAVPVPRAALDLQVAAISPAAAALVPRAVAISPAATHGRRAVRTLALADQAAIAQRVAAAAHQGNVPLSGDPHLSKRSRRDPSLLGRKSSSKTWPSCSRRRQTT